MASTPSTDTLLAFQFLHRAGPHVGPSGHSQESSRRPMPITLWLRHQTGRVPAGEDSGTAQRTKARLPASPLQMFQVKNSPFRGPLAQNPNLRIKTKYLLCHQKNRVLRGKNESWTLSSPCWVCCMLSGRLFTLPKFLHNHVSGWSKDEQAEYLSLWRATGHPRPRLDWSVSRNPGSASSRQSLRTSYSQWFEESFSFRISKCLWLFQGCYIPLQYTEIFSLQVKAGVQNCSLWDRQTWPRY